MSEEMRPIWVQPRSAETDHGFRPCYWQRLKGGRVVAEGFVSRWRRAFGRLFLGETYRRVDQMTTGYISWRKEPTP